MPFTNWIKKLDKNSKIELKNDLITLLSNEELLEYFDNIIDEIHNRGIDLEAVYVEYNERTRKF